MDNDNTPRGRDEAKRVMRGTEALLKDVLVELAQARRCNVRHLSATVSHVLTGFGLELVDVTRYALRELAKDHGRTALTDEEIRVLSMAARQFIAMAIELEREDEIARARALGARPTAPRAAQGAFAGATPPPARGAIPPPPPQPRRVGTRALPPPLPRQRAATIPVDVHTRITAPTLEADSCHLGDDDATPVELTRARR